MCQHVSVYFICEEEMTDEKRVRNPEFKTAAALIPIDVYKYVEEKATTTGNTLASYFRGWILEGYEKEKRKRR